MPVTSAGILLYRHRPEGIQVLLVHPGGPFWRNRDEGAWQIPKGEVRPGEEPLAAALREFEEELGLPAPGEPHPLARIRQKGGKWVEAFALEGELDPTAISSNLFEMEWPPRSGRIERFPEVDKAEWFTVEQARTRMLPSQSTLLEMLEQPPPR